MGQTRRLHAVAAPPPPPETAARQETPAPPYVGKLWRCDIYPNLTLILPELDRRAIAFHGGSYITKDAAEEAALTARRGTVPIRPYSGVTLFRCGLCDFADLDEAIVAWHRSEAHSINEVED